MVEANEVKKAGDYTRGVFSFIAILVIRLLPVIAFSMSTEKLSVTDFLANSIDMISRLTFSVTVLMYLISLVLRRLYKKFEHPKYEKWGTSLQYSSILILVITLLAPKLLMLV